DVPDLMAAADIFILPSRSEGLPLVLLEAMSAGLPIIATDVPGVSDALDGGRCGIIIPIEDPQAMSAGLLRLLSDETLRGHLGQAGRDYFRQEYTLDRMMSRYLDLLDPSGKISSP
ncbi:MAG: glycosyltransferase family 4 protein, partial [Chloroflexi bacterium]|nr:glycosyltransferase family 4 protein [Chloroflexota bacterium]